ncbi:MAG: alpha/beta fold hydrolase [Methanobacteriaceae archaeon]|nr:alpha/beta fold hydrolase [Methanobacteriaceae archaeon]
MIDINFQKTEQHILKEFKFENNKVLNDLPVEYITFGTPLYDDNNHIKNAIVYCHGSSGYSGSVKRIKEIIGENKPIDLSKFFIISLSTLGSPNSASPSTTKLQSDFPEYTIKDMVNFQREFLKEKYNITHLKGIIGNSMGGFEALTWAITYPDEMDFIISLVSGYRSAGQSYALTEISTHILKSDPDYNNGKYTKPLTRSLEIADEINYPFGVSVKSYLDLSKEEMHEQLDEMRKETSITDANDVIYRNNASNNYNVKNLLKFIKAKSLLIGIEEDQFFPPDTEVIPMHDLIENSKLIIFNSKRGHIGSNELTKINEDIEEFIKEFKE